MQMHTVILFALLFICFPKHSTQYSDSSQYNNQCSTSNLLETLGHSLTCVSSALSQSTSGTNGHCNMSNIEEIVKQLKDQTSLLSTISQGKPKDILAADCSQLLNYGMNVSGLYYIYPFRCCPNKGVLVFCDQETDGGGWTGIQRRANLPTREDFARSWIEYVLGFGDLNGEFWLGLENINALTNHALMELRIDLEDYEDEKRYAKYGKFHVGGKETKYKLSIGIYSGTAGDGFLDRHTGHPFSTFDEDNDSYEQNCAQLYPGGWWYDACHISNINGKPLVGKHSSYADGINWRPWKEYHYSLKKTSMLVRPAFMRNPKINP